MGKAKILNIGDKFLNARGYEYVVLEQMDDRKYNIRFTESGYTTISAKKEIMNGVIKDWGSPYVCGVGIVGKEIDSPQSHYLYDRWRDMLRRCYDDKCNGYATYGAIGVRVDERWFKFINYVNDIETKENHEKLKTKSCGWEIDKDLKGNNSKIYSNETTTIIREEDNTKERNKRMGNPAILQRLKVMQYSIDGEYIKTYNSITEATEILDKKYGCSSIVDCCKGKGKTAYGYVWMYETDFKDFETSRIYILKMINTKPKRKFKKIFKIDINSNNVIKIYNDVYEASKDLNIETSAIYQSIHRKSNGSIRGYILRYEGDN